MTLPQAGYTDVLSENEARNELILSELSQVYYLARRIHERLPQHVPLEDLVHAGVLGTHRGRAQIQPERKCFAEIVRVISHSWRDSRQPARARLGITAAAKKRPQRS